ncbi:MAG: 50S ribosomal protein L11 methyltransferase [Anaerolineales bacterium]|nr:MAG: 50S ribosomal protein L11 methyltransferase [Anaerolineales bacterium]
MSETHASPTGPDRPPVPSDPTDLGWIEISMEADGEVAEAVSAVFHEHSVCGAIVEELWSETSQPDVVRVKTFLPTDQEANLSQIEEAVWHLGQIYPLPPLSVRHLAETDWQEAWKSDYDVQRIGRRTVIKPSWQSYGATPDEIVIELDPGLAFGTGLHPSTRLCLLAAEKHLRASDSVLDVGTGSGILAIAAARMGAGKVVAVDADGTALKVAQENIVRNGVQETVSLQRASLYELSPGEGPDGPVGTFNATGLWDGAFDLLFMNILANVIVRSAEAISTCLAVDGLFVVSGIIEAQEQIVRQGLTAAGLTVLERYTQKDWVALVGRQTRLGKERGHNDTA